MANVPAKKASPVQNVINVPSALAVKIVKNVHVTFAVQSPVKNAKSHATANQMSKVKNATNANSATLV